MVVFFAPRIGKQAGCFVIKARRLKKRANFELSKFS